ncbi:OmpH family outer membrane protein [Cardiobacteriaceae bacterium TAE3-ERU3]|nr:OmpH family outer membrane protein [Cardiobacteriaceae bacterium TAE3-ERU3]
MSLRRSFLLILLGSIFSAQANAQEQQEAHEETVQPTDVESTNASWLSEQTTLDDEQTVSAAQADIVGRQLQGELHKANGDSLQLGFVNLRRVMASIPQLAILRARLDSEFAQQKAELDRQSDEIQAFETQLADMPRGDEYSELEKQVIAKRRTFARINASFRDAYSVRRNEELATLQQQVVDEIVNLAKEHGYDVILNDTGVIYVSAEADLTSIVIERLQQEVRQKQNDN